MEINNLLDKRLLAVSNFIDKCDVVADIGTDHGFIPIYLSLKNICKYCIASDNKNGPLNKAKENIALYSLNDRIQTILTDGLDNLPNNIDFIVIAGMGGHLISSILQKSKFKYPNLVLQANSHVEILRETLVLLGYSIVNEEIVKENDKYYEIIKAILKPSSLNEEEIKYGPINLKNKTDTFKLMYEERLNVLKNILLELKENSPSYNFKLKEIQELEKILK